ncbi:MAG TPA: hypothetical protein ENN10_00650 [Actinobacteria bacterium]|nr:hypothetical protein [Actinomycetota bacterium]
MSSSNLVVKLSFKSPDAVRVRAGNAAHLKYICTRPGVDTTVTDASLLRAQYRDVSADDAYLAYIAERPGVARETPDGPQLHGLFDRSGVADPMAVRGELNALESSPAYRIILSVREETAAAVGLVDKDSWEHFMCEQTPVLARGLGIPVDRLRWVAALHPSEGHPHLHVIAWDSADRKRGHDTIAADALVAMREELTRELWRPVCVDLGAEKGTIRDALVASTRSELHVVSELMDWAPAAPSADLRRRVAAPAQSPENLATLAAGLERVAAALPGRGRLALSYMPPETKAAVTEVVGVLLRAPENRAAVDRYIALAEQMARHQTSQAPLLAEARAAAAEDLEHRIGQSVLRAAADLEQHRLRERVWRAVPILTSRGPDPACFERDRVRAARACGAAGVGRETTGAALGGRDLSEEVAASWSRGAESGRLRNEDVTALERATGGERAAPVMAGLSAAAYIAAQVCRELDHALASQRVTARAMDARRKRALEQSRGIWAGAEPNVGRPDRER